jgi:hypothetical protein
MVSSMNWQLRRKTLVLSGTAVAVVSSLLAVAPSADAATGPTITQASCSESSYFFQCQIGWSGGTDPSAVRWVAVANSSIGGSLTNPAAHSSLSSGNCIPGSSYEVKATVTDATGLSASRFLGGPCDA